MTIRSPKKERSSNNNTINVNTVTAIEFDNVGKLYHLGVVGTGTLSHDLNRWWQTKVLRREDPYLKIGETNDRSTKGSSDFVWALRDITFSVEQGDVVGIIGKNGAGKSTLLKLLSQVTAPTTGSIKARGRIASLLEVGTGFHPELTGRENIYMNGSIMGMRKREIDAKLDEIVDFAGVARYIDTPVKRYSSGMTVRLGFAVAAFLEPEILVVDEVLAVGDAEFQKKAIGKMQDVASGQGRTVLFVSHNMAAVQSLCRRGILLENGRITYQGTAEETIDKYVSFSGSGCDNIIDNITYIKNGLDIRRISINGSELSQIEISSHTNILEVSIEGTLKMPLPLNIIISIKTKTNVIVASYYPNEATGQSLCFNEGHFKIHEKIALPEILHEGNYLLDIFLAQHQVEFFMKAINCAEIYLHGHTHEFGQVGKLINSGFMGLERIDVTCQGLKHQ